ncbi:uncharacterized protein LOC116346784 isoform X2 [Contarinia nasturtii]|uniref:uncharacterized protein LOC116346784 isoform X2 n=1 Tax=Contarinia nasturtii TaxID=265458 RepID=UPI0012D3D2F4|nr:uncharacterized protein LOC116346784 isoform X2 [Contarinia nasturtii]
MNIATVFKQSTTTSARMSTNIHSTELSTLSSINFDKFKRKKIYGQSHQQSCGKQIKTSVLMESNSVLNVVQELGNDRRRHRHTFGMGEQQLFKMLSSTPDEPLFINDTANSKAALNGCVNNSGDNLLIQYETATSSIATVDEYENENLPPADNNCATVAHIEDVETMSSTPQKGFSTAAWNKLQRDLNSPSASCRVRAIRAMNSPANANYYNNFDVTNGETTVSEEECSIEPPKTIEEVMKDVIVYVEFRSGAENRTNGVKTTIANLGAKVNDRLLRNTTHVVFKDGLQSTYNKAKSWNIPIVSILWIEACKKHLVIMDPKAYPISNIEKYENPDLYEKTKRQKCIQPDTLMKNLHRPIPKSKILEGLKKHNESDSSISTSSVIDKTPSPNLMDTYLNRKSLAPTTLPKVTQSRKSIFKKVDEKPKNTIRSMFMKQLEKSRTDNVAATPNTRRCTTYTPQPMEEAKVQINPITPVSAALTRLRRRTTYTPQAMEETKVQNNFSTVTPVTTTSRRKTMNVHANVTVHKSTTNHTSKAAIDAISQDAIQTPNHKLTGITCSTTPLINTLSKTHIDQNRSSTPKTLLEQYNSTFSSKKTPMTNKRRTIANITLDIIKQRIENLNRNVSLNQSTTDLLDDSIHGDAKSTPTPVENTEKMTTTPATGATNQNAVQLKPLKRKLFAPPSLFPENSPLLNTTTQKTDKKTATQKRKRNDLVATAVAASEEKKAPIIKSRPIIKKPTSRRSTMFFEEAPVRKVNHDTKPLISSLTLSATNGTTVPNAKKDNSSLQGLVFTSMHQSQIDFISEAVKKLGKFQLENKVSNNTTHLISDNRRTVNILRGIIRGVWILSYDWVVKSVELNKWQYETDYEMRTFSRAVEINRIERQAFGRHYRMDIFRCFDMFYLADNCTCKNLRELIIMCYGKVTKNVPDCCYFITEQYQTNIDSKKLIQVHPNWILDSITSGKVQKLATYLVANTTN